MAFQSSADVGGYVVQITLAIGAAVVTLQVWILRWLQKLERNTGATRVTLFGENGENGLNGTVKDHETRLRWLEGGHRA